MKRGPGADWRNGIYLTFRILQHVLPPGARSKVCRGLLCSNPRGRARVVASRPRSRSRAIHRCIRSRQLHFVEMGSGAAQE